MKILTAVVLFTIGVAAVASASAVPEIDPASGASAIALLSGALILMRGRRKQ
jgi:hypothetical protein